MKHACHAHQWFLLSCCAHLFVQPLVLSCATHMSDSSHISDSYCHVAHTCSCSDLYCHDSFSHILTCHVTHMYEWVMSHMSRTRMNESCPIYQWWVLSCCAHLFVQPFVLSRVTHMSDSYHTYESLMSHIWVTWVISLYTGVCNVTHSCVYLAIATSNVMCHTYEWFISHIHTYESLMSHIWVTWVILSYTGVCSSVQHHSFMYVHDISHHGVATISRLLKIIGLFGRI